MSVIEIQSETELCSHPFGTVQSSSKRIAMGVESGAEGRVWPQQLFPEVATVVSEESRREV